jgi:hypothetical protein
MTRSQSLRDELTKFLKDLQKSSDKLPDQPSPATRGSWKSKCDCPPTGVNCRVLSPLQSLYDFSRGYTTACPDEDLAVITIGSNFHNTLKDLYQFITIAG